jgi:uncharacterized membrane protein YraQ (UPF0718 family)
MGWGIIYWHLELFSHWLTYSIFDFSENSRLGNAIHFLIYETPKVLMLLVLVVFAVGIIRSFFTPERTRKILSGRRTIIGSILAAILGIVTPFCSCSAVPLFIGFVTAGVPLGVTFAFLVSAPMVNEVALVLLFGMFGWKVAAIYLGMGLLIAIISGWIISMLTLEKYIEEWVFTVNAGSGPDEMDKQTWSDRIRFAKNSVRDIVGKVWLYVLLGIAVGSGIHGYVPENFLASLMGKSSWWSVPLVVILGVPMYSNAAGIIPVVSSLLEKGASMGTALAFMMSVIALSLPEAIILRKVLKRRLIFIFFGIVASGILLVGYVFNFIF